MGAARLGAAGIIAIAVTAVASGVPTLLRDAGSEARRNDALSFSDREIAGGNGIVVDQEAVYAARALIPEGASYHVAVDPDYEAGTELTRDHVASYFRYFLLPRRPLEGGAQWIVCYGCNLAEYGPDADIVWRGEGDISIVRVGS